MIQYRNLRMTFKIWSYSCSLAFLPKTKSMWLKFFSFTSYIPYFAISGRALYKIMASYKRTSINKKVTLQAKTKNLFCCSPIACAVNNVTWHFYFGYVVLRRGVLSILLKIIFTKVVFGEFISYLLCNLVVNSKRSTTR